MRCRIALSSTVLALALVLQAWLTLQDAPSQHQSEQVSPEPLALFTA